MRSPELLQTASSFSFSSDLVRGVHARASVQWPLPPRAFSHARGKKEKLVLVLGVCIIWTKWLVTYSTVKSPV